MPANVERHEDCSLIRLEGECTVTGAAEFKTLLLDGLAPGGSLRLDLERVEEIDIAIMQLLWTAGNEAERIGCEIAISASEVAENTARGAGFSPFPGLTARTPISE